MSQTNTLINAIVALLETDLTSPRYTVEGFFTQLHSVDSEQRPLAMVFEPTEENAEDALGGIEEATSVSIILLRDPGEGVGMRDDADTVRDVFDKTPRITTNVDRSFISASVVLETLEKYTVAVLTLETVRGRSA